MTIGERIKLRRKELGLTVDQVAEKLNKNRATIYRYESNDIESLPITIIEPLAKVLNTTPAWLMGWEINIDDKELSPEELKYAKTLEGFKKSILKGTEQSDFEVLQKTTSIEEFIGSLKPIVNETNDILYGKYGKSIQAFIDFIGNTFPEINEIDIYDLKKLYDDVKKFTAFDLSKIIKNKKPSGHGKYKISITINPSTAEASFLHETYLDDTINDSKAAEPTEPCDNHKVKELPKKEEETPEHLKLSAAHEIKGASKEDKQHDNDIIDNE